MKNRDCERPAPSLCLMGLTEAELATLEREGIQQERMNMVFAGYRTYIVAFAMVAMGVAKALGVAIPDDMWMVLSGLGLGSLRAAVDGK